MPLTRRSYYLGSFAWASLPVASATPGYWARVSDVGVQLRVVSDGARWVPDGIQILARSAVAASCPADVTEDTLATIVVPAGILGVSGGLRIDATWTITNSANNKTMRHTFAGTAFSAITLTASGGLRQLSTLQNRNATNAQVGGISAGTAGGVGAGNTAVTAAIDTTANQNLILTGQKTLAGETITLERYQVDVLP